MDCSWKFDHYHQIVPKNDFFQLRTLRDLLAFMLLYKNIPWRYRNRMRLVLLDEFACRLGLEFEVLKRWIGLEEWVLGTFNAPFFFIKLMVILFRRCGNTFEGKWWTISLKFRKKLESRKLKKNPITHDWDLNIAQFLFQMNIILRTLWIWRELKLRLKPLKSSLFGDWFLWFFVENILANHRAIDLQFKL